MNLVEEFLEEERGVYEAENNKRKCKPLSSERLPGHYHGGSDECRQFDQGCYLLAL